MHDQSISCSYLLFSAYWSLLWLTINVSLRICHLRRAFQWCLFDGYHTFLLPLVNLAWVILSILCPDFSLRGLVCILAWRIWTMDCSFLALCLISPCYSKYTAYPRCQVCLTYFSSNATAFTAKALVTYFLLLHNYLRRLWRQKLCQTRFIWSPGLG